jgi:hypothetical protein
MPAIVEIQIRNGEASLWLSENPILLEAEIGFETDTLKAKIGDGVTAWSLLPYWDLGLGVGALIAALSTKQDLSEKDQPDGYASLDGSGKIPSALLPAIAITDTFPVASQAEMLALDAETGDVAIRSDEPKSYILKGTDPSNLSHWAELLSPGLVVSVNGQNGNVTLSTTHIAEGSNQYFTVARVLSSALTGIVFTDSSAIISTDSVLVALGKLQAQINAIPPVFIPPSIKLLHSHHEEIFYNTISEGSIYNYEIRPDEFFVGCALELSVLIDFSDGSGDERYAVIRASNDPMDEFGGSVLLMAIKDGPDRQAGVYTTKMFFMDGGIQLVGNTTGKHGLFSEMAVESNLDASQSIYLFFNAGSLKNDEVIYRAIHLIKHYPGS